MSGPTYEKATIQDAAIHQVVIVQQIEGGWQIDESENEGTYRMPTLAQTLEFLKEYWQRQYKEYAEVYGDD